MTRRSSVALSLLLAVVACSAPEALVTNESLAPTMDTVIVPYFDVTDAAWLGTGQWVVLSPQDRAVARVDFRGRRFAPFAGPPRREIAQPFQLFRAGDSVYVADWQRRRLTTWTLDGRLTGEVPAADQFRGTLPRARDAAGRWYFELRRAPGRDGRGNLDSAAVVRTTADFSRGDTTGRLAPFDLAEVTSDGRTRLERRLLSGQDQWGVLPSGAVWVARVSQNRVDWRDTSGVLHRGRELPDRVLPVTQNDRDLFLQRFDVALRPTVEQIPFAAIKAPFEGALASPDGQVWLVKNRAVGDTVREYQIVNPAGVLVRVLTHRGIGRAVALGGDEVLVAEPFEQGVRLLSFRLPAAAAAVPESSR